MYIVTEHFPSCIKAEQKGNNVLIMRNLNEPFKRFDGKKAIYELEYRWLSNPEDLTSVQGAEFTYWRKSEWDPKIDLFAQFNLF